MPAASFALEDGSPATGPAPVRWCRRRVETVIDLPQRIAEAGAQLVALPSLLGAARRGEGVRARFLDDPHA